MSILKKIIRLTPAKLSFAVVLFFSALTLFYYLAPDQMKLIDSIFEKSIDYKFAMRGARKPKSKVVIVAADEKAFQKYGQWPFDRGAVFAPLLETLCKYNPKAVGLDLVWSEPEKLMTSGVRDAIGATLGENKNEFDNILKNHSGDAQLRKAIESCGNKIVLGYALSQNEDSLPKGEFERRLKFLVTPANKINGKHGPQIKFSASRENYSGNVSFYNVAKSGLLNIPELTPEDVSQGFFNNDPDSDGNYRHAFFLYNAGDQFVPSLAYRTAQKYLTPKDNGSWHEIWPRSESSSEALSLELSTPTEVRKFPIDLQGRTLVNYRGPNQTFPNISIADVLGPDDAIEYDLREGSEYKRYKVHKSDFFKDALVLIGVTAQAIYDIRPRPFDEVASGVENHANIIDNIVNGDFLVRPTNEVVLAWIAAVFLGGLFFGWIVAKLDAKWGALVGAFSIAAILWLDQVYMFNERNIVTFGSLFAAQLLFQYLLITVVKYMQEESEKKFIRSAFDKYVSPDVVSQMIRDPSKLKIGGDKKELSILFSDIRGFTELSERLEVKALSQFLNEYLGAMTDILQSNSGTLDKYIGDAVMGFWGAPLDNAQHARLAVKTAIEMVNKLEELNKDFETRYGLEIDIGIGINTGPVTVGNFGSSRVFSYTVIGDNVNLASRLEGVNKQYGTRILVSESTFDLLPEGEFLSREIDTVKVKGKQKPVKIYEVFPDNPKHEPLKTSLKSFNEGLRAYYSRRWDEAVHFFNAVLLARDGDKPSLELIGRCKYYIENPPASDWDGSWEMRSK